MSAKATFWAWGQDAQGTSKLVLLALADTVNHDDVCWPSKSRVAAMCGVSVKSVQRALRELEEVGLIESDSRFRGDGSQTSSAYHLRVPPEPDRPPTPGQDDPAILEPTQKEPIPPNPIEDALDQASFLPDPVNETWELYATLMERPRAVLTPKVRKWIRDAHEAVGVEMTQQAIRGLAASDYHRDKGYIGIEHAIRAKQNETIEGRVEMMAAKAKAQPAMIANSPMSVDEWVDHFASADVRRVARESVNAIDQMMERPGDDNAQLQGTVATRRLSGNGYRPVVEDGRVVRVERV